MQLQELLEAPLIGAEGEAWKKQPRQMPEQFEEWIDAQMYSRHASEQITNFKDVIFPLEKTKKQPVLDKMWTLINAVSTDLSDLLRLIRFVS